MENGQSAEREPGIEHVRILIQSDVGGEMMFAARFRLAARDVDVAFGVIPGGDAMSPPQLPADTPVLDVAHPLEVGLGPALRHEARRPGLDCRDGGSGERRDPDIPLIGQIGLEHRAAAITPRHRELVLLDPDDQAGRLQLGHDALAGLEAIEPAERVPAHCR